MSFSRSSKLYCLYPRCVSAKWASLTILLLLLFPRAQDPFQFISETPTLVLRSLFLSLLNRCLHLANDVNVASAFPCPALLHPHHHRSPSHLTHNHSFARTNPRQ